MNTRRSPPPRRANIELTSRSSTAAALCEILDMHVHGFDPVNVTTALRKLLAGRPRRHAAGRNGTRALKQLEGSALEHMA